MRRRCATWGIGLPGLAPARKALVVTVDMGKISLARGQVSFTPSTADDDDFLVREEVTLCDGHSSSVGRLEPFRTIFLQCGAGSLKIVASLPTGAACGH